MPCRTLSEQKRWEPEAIVVCLADTLRPINDTAQPVLACGDALLFAAAQQRLFHTKKHYVMQKFNVEMYM